MSHFYCDRCGQHRKDDAQSAHMLLREPPGEWSQESHQLYLCDGCFSESKAFIAKKPGADTQRLADDVQRAERALHLAQTKLDAAKARETP